MAIGYSGYKSVKAAMPSTGILSRAGVAPTAAPPPAIPVTAEDPRSGLVQMPSAPAAPTAAPTPAVTASEPVAATTPIIPASTPIAAPDVPESIGALPEVTKQQIPTFTAPTLPELQPSQTVQGRIAALTTQENPLLTAARTRAMQQAQARGLLSSTMAEQAATAGVIETALPIAEADAAAEQRRQEMQFQAEQRQEELRFQTEVEAERDVAEAQRRREELKFATDAELAAEARRSRTQIGIANMDDQTRRDLAAADITSRENLTKIDTDLKAAQFAESVIDGHKTRYQAGATAIGTTYGQNAANIRMIPDAQLGATPAEAEATRRRMLQDNQVEWEAAVDTHNNLFDPANISGWDESWEAVPDTVGDPYTAPVTTKEVLPEKALRDDAELDKIMVLMRNDAATAAERRQAVAYLKYMVQEKDDAYAAQIAHRDSFTKYATRYNKIPTEGWRKNDDRAKQIASERNKYHNLLGEFK